MFDNSITIYILWGIAFTSRRVNCAALPPDFSPSLFDFGIVVGWNGDSGIGDRGFGDRLGSLPYPSLVRLVRGRA